LAGTSNYNDGSAPAGELSAVTLTCLEYPSGTIMRFFKNPQIQSRLFVMRYLTVLLATMVHVFAFLFLFQQVGSEISLIAVLPVITVGWLFRRRLGLVAGFAAVLLNVALYGVLGVPFLEAVYALSGPGSVIIIIIGGIVGRSRELLDQVNENSEALKREIAERERAQLALRAAKEEAEAANEAKSEMVTFVSHELRSPISAIMLSQELLATRVPGELNESQLTLVRAIDDNVKRMLNLVTDLTDVSRLENGALLLELGPVSLADTIKELLPSLKVTLAKKEQKLVLEVPRQLPRLWCDRERLIQVITNLVGNAHKYTPAAGQITIRAATSVDMGSANRSAEFVRVTVQDNGIGISRQDQERIFGKFFRAQDAQAGKVPGTGLGLAIAKNLVELQHGRIWFESEVKQGTRFHFTLPAVRNGHRPKSFS